MLKTTFRTLLTIWYEIINTIPHHTMQEIRMKAVSGILLLLLKHFKINHIYQFECFSASLVDANCIVLILKLLNQNAETFITCHNRCGFESIQFVLMSYGF